MEAMNKALWSLANGALVAPTRSQLPTESGLLLCMPAQIKSSETIAVKLVSVRSSGVQGLAVAFDEKSGAPRAVVDAAALTALRTSAMSALAACLLAPQDATSLAVFGAGVQARAHIDSFIVARPSIRAVRVFNRTRPKAEAIVANYSAKYKDIVFSVAESPEACVREAQLIVTCTASTSPLFPTQALLRGAYVTCVGSFMPSMREVDADLVHRARVVVDSVDALHEAGELRQVLDGQEITLLQDIVGGSSSRERGNNDFVLFKSCGHAAQDAAAMEALLLAAWQLQVGQRVFL